MFTSSRFAPPRTCSRATSTAPWSSPPSMSRRNRRDPVTLVRSPIITNPVSGPIAKVSRPLKRVRGGSAGSGRGVIPDTAVAICVMWAGVVPQQPPTMLTSPAPANSASSREVSSGVWSYPPKALGRPAFGWQAV